MRFEVGQALCGRSAHALRELVGLGEVLRVAWVGRARLAVGGLCLSGLWRMLKYAMPRFRQVTGKLGIECRVSRRRSPPRSVAGRRANFQGDTAPARRPCLPHRRFAGWRAPRSLPKNAAPGSTEPAIARWRAASATCPARSYSQPRVQMRDRDEGSFESAARPATRTEPSKTQQKHFQLAHPVARRLTLYRHPHRRLRATRQRLQSRLVLQHANL